MTRYANRTGLMIGIPLSGNALVPDFTFAFHQLSPPMNYNVEYTCVKGKPVADARNQIAEAAVAKNCKYLFFLDEDVTCPPHTIRQLIYHMEHWPKVAVAAGIYCHKSPPQMPMVFRGNGAGPFWDWKIGEVFEVSGTGMGCTLIRVDAFKTVPKPWFKTVEDLSAVLEGVNHAEVWTEDLYFEDKLSKAEGEGVPEGGWQIIADGGLLCEHWDPATGQSYSLPPTAKPLQRQEVKVGTKKIIDLGCGENEVSYTTDEGPVLRVDVREDANPDYRCDLRKLPFATGEFDIVFSSHTLEHFGRQEISDVMAEWCRILKEDGEMRLVLPNIKWAAQHILNDEIDVHVLNVLYGAQTYDTNFHKIGFIPQTIEQLLAANGFKKFVWDFYQYHMFVRAWRIPPPDDQISEQKVERIAAKQQTFAEHVKEETEKEAKAAEEPVPVEVVG